MAGWVGRVGGGDGYECVKALVHKTSTFSDEYIKLLFLSWQLIKTRDCHET